MTEEEGADDEKPEQESQGNEEDDEADRIFEAQHQFVHVLKQIIRQEKKIDALKEDLALCTDFSVEAAIALIDTEKEGKVTAEKLAEFLNETKPTMQDIELLIKKHDILKDSKIGYTEFNYMLRPSDPAY